MSGLSAIIFDLDGTLVDSLDDITYALNGALESIGRPPAQRDQVRGWVGDGLPQLCRRACPDVDEDEIQQVIANAAQWYREACTAATRPYGNILKMLDLLKAQGAPMAVLSNKPDDLTKRVIHELKLASYFVDARGMISESDRKPSPDAALAQARSMGIRPEKVLLVGDSVVDIQTARNAGMVAASVLWGFQEKKLLESARPDHFVSDPMEIFFLWDEKKKWVKG